MIRFSEYCETTDELAKCLKEKAAGRRMIAVIDHNVDAHWGQFFPFEKIVIEASERNKTMETVNALIEQLMELHADRGVLLLGIGGGITTDICGFVAAIYKRGVAVGLVPTTLLAMVDAAIGGKNGVNMQGYKNMVGTFRQPEFICCHPKFLATLPQKEVRNGLAEMLKSFIIKGKHFVACAEFFRAKTGVELCTEAETTMRFIQEAANVKMEIVAEDECEQGKRRLLNLGHTFAHALEHCTGISHGEAVAIGLVCAAKNGKSPDTELIVNTLKSCGLPTEIPQITTPSVLLKAMSQDKKMVEGKCLLVIIHRIGDISVRPTALKDIVIG